MKHTLPILLACLLFACSDDNTPTPDPEPEVAPQVELVDDTITTEEDTPVDLDPLANDTGADTIDALGSPQKGEATLVGQQVRYTPAPDFNGEDSFTYTASGKEALITIAVTPVNDSPQPAPDFAHTPQREPVEIDVLANDIDPDGDTLRLLGVTLAQGGRTSVMDGRVLYQPSASFTGSDRFTVRIRDEGGAEVDSEVYVAVGGEPGGPLAFDDSVVLIEGEPTELDVLANDLSPEGETLAVEILDAPNHIEITQEGNALTLLAAGGFNGHEAIALRVVDAQGRSALSQVDATVFAAAPPQSPQVIVPRTGIVPRELALVINADDPISEPSAAHYAEQRGIPQENIVTVSLGTANGISPEAFEGELARVAQRLPDHIQAYALAWTAPYLVGCMSMTSAFALGGYDDQWCNTSGRACSITAPVDTFDTDSTRPFDDHGVRPAMMLAGVSIEEVRALIDRGVAADHTFPTGDGYLLRTTDAARSVRHPDFETTARLWNASMALSMQFIDSTTGDAPNVLTDVDDILFYLTGLTQVADLDTLSFRPGAAADHLTSFGGRLTATSGQMSIVRWLEAGATASYGTAVEPCNYLQKFPQASILLDQYYRGATLLEAYWKSVLWPGEGVFVGEPLASPWGRATITFADQTLTIATTTLEPGRAYLLQAAERVKGPFETVQTIEIEAWGVTEIRQEDAREAVYRLIAAP